MCLHFAVDFGEITFVISSGNEDGLFKIDVNSGTLSLTGVLDYETKTEVGELKLSLYVHV